MSKILQGACGPLITPPAQPWRTGAAVVLRTTSHLMARLARRLRKLQPAEADTAAPRLEFYCEAGAPEGALYIDGELVARLPGVTRL
ncbi:MAG: hypothetical protein HUU30_11275 [Burkholderiaceae bacterium]|jgi:hypothetical protein|nr:hypothetical protein [Aquabacterium sp.]NUP86317.1 hypothetical protein [Burkholderiaceae bacterium]